MKSYKKIVQQKTFRISKENLMRKWHERRKIVSRNLMIKLAPNCNKISQGRLIAISKSTNLIRKSYEISAGSKKAQEYHR
jgi:hypothetical protein